MLAKFKKIIPKFCLSIIRPPYHYFLDWLAALVYGFPSRKLIVIGVTGTAGKTSTVYLIARLLTEAGYKTGFTSTAVFSDGQKEWLNDQKMTMPGKFFISRLLKKMLKNNCTYAIVETTSEGIKQFRHRFINYDILIFTGLYPEHLESHGSFENYKQAKGKLFSHLKNCTVKYVDDNQRVVKSPSHLKKLDLTRISKTTIINGDDAQADYFLNFWSETKIIFSISSQLTELDWLNKLKAEVKIKDLSVIKAENIKVSASGTSFKVQQQTINLKLLGSFNVKNALAAIAVGLNQNLNLGQIKTALELVRGLAGKLQLVDVGQDFKAVVDYSFEPKALENLYQVLDLLDHKKIIHVLGSTGGGRDKSRRPILGSLAGQKADLVIITNEDPYDEDPQIIIDQVAAGAESVGKVLNHNLFKIMDRREAIKKAVGLAKKNDLVLITGKGAEQFICVANGQKIPWDEINVLKEEIVDKMCIDKK